MKYSSIRNLVGLTINAAVAQNRSPNHGIVGMNHVGISVPNLDAAIAYYTKALGFPEAFRRLDSNGNPDVIYFQISRDTFVEVQPATPQRPQGITHFGVEVENMNAATEMFKQRGANASPITVSATKAILSQVTDPNGVGARMELLELPPDSLTRQAMERWGK